FHAPSRVRYSLYSENGAAWLSFERAGNRSVRGKRQLLYFIGSGPRGRTYLFAEDGFVFEAPINRQIPMTLPALPGCWAAKPTVRKIPCRDLKTNMTSRYSRMAELPASGVTARVTRT